MSFECLSKDDLLEQGVALFSTSNKTCWENISKLIGHGMSWTQCRQRWQRYVKDREAYSRDGEEWTDSEVNCWYNYCILCSIATEKYYLRSRFTSLAVENHP